MRRILICLVLACGVLFNLNCSGSKSPTSANNPQPTQIPGTPTLTPVWTYPSPTPLIPGNGGATGIDGNFASPFGVAVDSAYIAVSDPGLPNIQIFNKNGVYLYEIDSTTSGATTITAPSSPNGMAFDAKHNLYVVDTGTAEVDVYALTNSAGTWKGYYVGGGAITGPMDVKFDNGGNLVVADYNSQATFNIDFASDTVLSTS